MKRIGLVLIAIACTTITSISQNPEIIKSALSEGQVVVATVYSKGLETNLLGDSPDRKVYVYLPPGYEESPDIKYPVVYLLIPWGTGVDYYFGGSTDPTIDIKQIVDGLISQSKVSPMIVVSPDIENSYRGSYFSNSIVTGNWEDFLFYDLVQFIDSNFNTLQQTESRGIAGYSNGGYGAIKLAMKHPDIFGVLFTLSSSRIINMGELIADQKENIVNAIQLGCENFESLSIGVQRVFAQAAAFAPNPTFPCLGEFPYSSEGILIDSVSQKWLLHDVTTMLPSYTDSMLKLRFIHLEAGTEGDGAYEPNLHFSKAMTDLGIEHVLDSFPGNHSNMRDERFEKSLLPFFSRSLSKNILTDTVFIPDTAFLHALIEEGVDTNGDSLISYEEAETIQAVFIGERGIKEMTGIEAFLNLGTLYCPDNQLTSLDVSKNTALEALDCAGNQLTSLDVSKNTALSFFECSYNQLTSIDVSNNNNLRKLRLSGNQLTTLDISTNPNFPTFIPPSGGTSLSVGDMPSLGEICVWEGFNFEDFNIDRTGSPNVCFQTDCNGDCSIVGIDDNYETGISIYPNPTYTLLTIETVASDIINIEITSLNGQLIFNEELEGPTHQLDISSFKKGVYFITIRSKDYVTTKKIIKL